jgi:hypothetical protein
VRTLEARGHRVIAHDLICDGIDFLTVTQPPPDVGAIVTNPPFSRAAEFVRHGLRLVPKVIVLERIQFLETEERAELFDSGMLAKVWVFRHRVPRMHKVGWTGKRSSPAMCLAWFVFERDHLGAPMLDWLRLPQKSKKPDAAPTAPGLMSSSRFPTTCARPSAKENAHVCVSHDAKSRST